MAAGHDIIVIGASAGGIEAVAALAKTLPADLPAALFVVVHTSAESPGYLAAILQRAGELPARVAVDGEPVRPGAILVAPPDQHLLLSAGRVRLSRGARENRCRPAVDPLFRSAAAAFTTRVVGIVLSGMLDDGAAGLRAIKRCGGRAMVQEPAEARFPDMPRNAMAATEVDFRLPVGRMGESLAQLARTPAAPPLLVPDDILWEVRMQTREEVPAKTTGENSDLSCPACGGVLQTIPDAGIRRFRCHTGHAYTLAHLVQEQGEKVEEALWAALRNLEEHGKMLTRMAEGAGPHSAPRYRKRQEEAYTHAEQIRMLIESLANPGLEQELET